MGRARARADARPARTHAPKPTASWSLNPASDLGLFTPHISQRFAAVTAVAEALQIAGVTKQRPIALVVDNVVNVRRPRPHTPPGALTAKRLAQELLRPQMLRPHRLAVPASPSLRRPHVLRLVCLTVAGAGQSPAPWMPAWSQWLTSQGYHLLRKSKAHRDRQQHAVAVRLEKTKAHRNCLLDSYGAP